MVFAKIMATAHDHVRLMGSWALMCASRAHIGSRTYARTSPSNPPCEVNPLEGGFTEPCTRRNPLEGGFLRVVVHTKLGVLKDPEQGAVVEVECAYVRVWGRLGNDGPWP